MDRAIRSGDVIVCRVNGTSDFYVVATVVSGIVGALALRSPSTIAGQAPALWHAYEQRTQGTRVWLFDGAAAAYVETAAPAAPQPRNA